MKTDEKRHPKVLITGENVYWTNVRDLTGRLRKGDAFFHFVTTELKKQNYKIVSVYPLGYSISGFKTLIDKLEGQKDVTHRAVNVYWSIKIWKKAYDANRRFRNIWRNILEKNGKLTNLLDTYGLRTELSYCFNSVFERVVKNIEIAKEIVEREKPDLILLLDEYQVFERALVVAGKLKGIPTLAIQHGFIGPLHMGYMYSRNSISASGSIETPYCPIPDKTAVYGQYYSDLLTKVSAYPPISVVVTGSPRYDVLAVADKVFSREEFCARLKLDSGKKIVLVLTENLGVSREEAVLRGFLRALKNFPEVQIVIKPHPGEKGDWYRKVVEKENIRGVMLRKDSETFEALYACDLLLAEFSTTIMEAIILGKPAVTINLSKIEEPAPHFKEVTLRVYREEDLVPAIRKALYDEKMRKELKKVGKKFVYEHAYKQDGKATERVTRLIEKMIKKS